MYGAEAPFLPVFQAFKLSMPSSSSSAPLPPPAMSDGTLPARAGMLREPKALGRVKNASTPLLKKPTRPPSATRAPYGSVRQKSCILEKPAGAAVARARRG